MRDATGNAYHSNVSVVWGDVPKGGGGYASNCGFHSSGRQWMGTDTTSTNLRDPGDAKWTCVFTTATVADTSLYSGGGSGRNCIRGAFAPSDKNRFYSNLGSYIMTVDIDPLKKLTDPGAITCTKWNLTAKYMNGGAGFARWWHGFIGVHPTDKDIALVGTTNEGAYYTLNGGDPVVQVSGLPTGTAGTGMPTNEIQTFAASDPGDANYWYIFIPGFGLYRSTTGVTGTFSFVSGGPLGCACLIVDQLGRVWICGDWRYTGAEGLWWLDRGGSTWGQNAIPLAGHTGISQPWCVKVDPFNSNRLFIAAEQVGGYSTNRGVNFTSTTITADLVGECAWHQTGAPKLGGGFDFDPTVQYRMLWGEGFGPCVSTQDFASTFHLADYSKGMEQTIAVGFNTNPLGTTVLFCMDLHATKYTSLTTYTNYPSYGPYDPAYSVGDANRTRYRGVQIGGYPDWAIDDNRFWVQACQKGHFYNENDADPESWRFFPAQVDPAAPTDTTRTSYPKGCDGPHGVAAVGTKNNIIIAPTNAANIMWSNDRGVTFNRLLLNGSSDYITNYSSTLRNRIVLSSDKSQANIFAVVIAPSYINVLRDFDFHPSNGSPLDEWTMGNSATLTNNNTGDLTNGAALAGYAYQAHYLQGGVTYRIFGDVSAASPTAGVLKVGTTPGASDVASLSIGIGVTNAQTTFTPGATGRVYFSMVVGSSTLGATTQFDNLGLLGTTPASNGNALAGLWLIDMTSGTAVATQKIAGIIVTDANPADKRQFWQAQLMHVPGFAGEVLYTSHSDQTTDPLLLITGLTPGGTAVRSKPNALVTDVVHFGFGPVYPGQTRPSVAFYGKYNGVVGVWLTTDWFVTFTKTSDQYPNGYLVQLNGVSAHPTTPGLIYGSLEGRGAVFSTYSDPMTFH